VFQDYVSLEQGKIQWSGGSAFRAKSGNLEVVGTGLDSTALVVRKGSELPGGQLLKAIAAGTAFSFGGPQQAEAGATGQAGQTAGSTTTAGTTSGTTAGTTTGTTTGTTAGAAGAAGAAGTTAGIAGLSIGTLAAIGAGVVAAIAIPIAVVATRDSTPVSN
jgi:hypothetical protein